MTTYHGSPVGIGYHQAELSPAAAQVFLSYSVADLTLQLAPKDPEKISPVPVINAIRHLLLEAGFIVWDHQQLCCTDMPEDVAISRSIEACDNLVVLLTPHSMRHALCLQGLLFAISMNKRIIPILLETIDIGSLPTQLQILPVIDLRSATGPLATTQAGQQLVQALAHGADYHSTHKQLLMQALKWERQQRNPCLLMRGDCLQQYDTWLEQAQRHPQYPPIRLQSLFIETSHIQPQSADWHVHLIYAPADATYAQQLSDLLQLFNKCTSFDYLNHLIRGNPRQYHKWAIEQSHHCMCIFSAEAPHNETFLTELDYALSLHKPLIMVTAASVSGEALPTGLNHCPRFVWSDLTTESARNFGKLFRLLEHQGAAASYHTQLLKWALQWDRHGRDLQLLLRRHHLRDAVIWLQNHPHPEPTPLQQAYIQASQNQGAWWSGVQWSKTGPGGSSPP